MTIHAITRNKGVFKQRRLKERSQVALVDAHLAVHLIAGGDQAVYQEIVHGDRAYVNGKRVIPNPAFIPVFGLYCDLQTRAGAGGEQILPFRYSKGDYFPGFYSD